jgi:hypothetical protein
VATMRYGRTGGARNEQGSFRGPYSAIPNRVIRQVPARARSHCVGRPGAGAGVAGASAGAGGGGGVMMINFSGLGRLASEFQNTSQANHTAIGANRFGKVKTATVRG